MNNTFYKGILASYMEALTDTESITIQNAIPFTQELATYLIIKIEDMGYMCYIIENTLYIRK